MHPHYGWGGLLDRPGHDETTLPNREPATTFGDVGFRPGDYGPLGAHTPYPFRHSAVIGGDDRRAFGRKPSSGPHGGPVVAPVGVLGRPVGHHCRWRHRSDPGDRGWRSRRTRRLADPKVSGPRSGPRALLQGDGGLVEAVGGGSAEG